MDGEQILIENRAQWRAWLEDNHAASAGIWLVTWRRATGRPAPSYEEVVQEALCFGWVDSRQVPVDGERTALRFTPRKPGSPWARTNKDRIAVLRRAGLMAAAGERVVAAAQADGSWSILDDVDNLVMPDDLTTALRALPPAADNFAAFSPSARRAALQWIILARRPQTRADRISRIVSAAQRNQRATP